MTCHNCLTDMVKAGFYGKSRVQRWKCQQCGKRFSEPQQKPFGADVRLPAEKVRMILHCLVEGNSVRGTARLCDVEKRTVLNILKLAGENCERLLTERIRNVKVQDSLELDEVWTFVGCKQKRLTPERFEKGMRGDAYTFIALERESRLLVAWHLGKRDRINTEDFVSKVRWATVCPLRHPPVQERVMFEVLTLPLTGVRVLDLSAIVAGPTTSMILADLGADVIKVERPGGEDGRAMGPHRGPWGAYFVQLNRGKRSICIDITKPPGRDAVLRLAGGCDVFLENFRGGKAVALGLEEAAVRARRPDIVYASLSAYGPRGPESARAGYDAVLQARTGIMSITGHAGTEPVRCGVSILDMGAGVWMALGIVTALLERQRSGQGQRVDSSLFQTGIMFMAYHLLYRQFTAVNPQPQGSGHTAFAPYGAFATTDGAIMLGISSDRLFRNLCAALGKRAWAGDARFRTNTDRVRHRAELDGLIQETVRTRPSAHWLALLTEHDVACDAVQDAGQVLEDAQLAALGQLAEVPLPGQAAAAAPRLPIELSQTSAGVSGPPPAAGEHTREILREAGYGDTDIDQLIASGVCRAGE